MANCKALTGSAVKGLRTMFRNERNVRTVTLSLLMNDDIAYFTVRWKTRASLVHCIQCSRCTVQTRIPVTCVANLWRIHRRKCYYGYAFRFSAALIWRRILLGLCKCCVLESIPSTPLNGSLRNFNTWRVSVGNRTHTKRFLGIGPAKIWGPKATHFRRLCNSVTTLRANISGKEHDRVNRETAMETKKGPLRYFEISWTLVH